MSNDFYFLQKLTLNDIKFKTNITIIDTKNDNYMEMSEFNGKYVISKDGNILNKSEYDKLDTGYILTYNGNYLHVLFDDTDEDDNLINNFDYYNESFMLSRYSLNDPTEILQILTDTFNKEFLDDENYHSIFYYDNSYTKDDITFKIINCMRKYVNIL